MFEAVALKVLRAAANIKRAAELLGLNCDAMHSVIRRAVDRGLTRRQLDGIHHVGIDEKSFGSGQDHISLMTDLHANGVLEVTTGRTIESCGKLWATLSDEQRERVSAEESLSKCDLRGGNLRVELVCRPVRLCGRRVASIHNNRAERVMK